MISTANDVELEADNNVVVIIKSLHAVFKKIVYRKMVKKSYLQKNSIYKGRRIRNLFAKII